MASGVLIAGVQRGYECRRERQTRSLESFVCYLQLSCGLLLLAVERMESMSGDSWSKEQNQAPHRNPLVRIDEKESERYVEGNGTEQNGLQKLHEPSTVTASSYRDDKGRQAGINGFQDDDGSQY
jgi:hypothetical protein